MNLSSLGLAQISAEMHMQIKIQRHWKRPMSLTRHRIFLLETTYLPCGLTFQLHLAGEFYTLSAHGPRLHVTDGIFFS